MRILFRLLIPIILLSLVAAPCAFIAFSLQQQPEVVTTATLSPDEVARVRRLLREHDPRYQREGSIRTADISSADAGLMLNYLLGRFGASGVELQLEDGVAAAVRASFEVPDNPLGRYINIALLLREAAGLPVLDAMRIGRINVPPTVGRWLYQKLIDQVDQRAGNVLTGDVIRQVVWTEHNIQVTYQWRADVLTAITEQLIDDQLARRIEAYQRYFVEFSNAQQSRRVDLADVLQAAMSLAEQRSTDGSHVEENRAAILAMEALVNGRNFSVAIPEAAQWPRPASRTIELRGRRDFAQHYMLSAALVALGDQSIAQAIGMFKEIDDSRGGSGFSFRDLAADKAGTLFGELALRSTESARSLQKQAAGGISAADIMPLTDDLPESLNEQTFARRFGSIDDDRFKSLVSEIDARVARLPLFAD